MYIQSNHLSDTAEAYGDYNVAERENITVNSFPQQKQKMWVRLVPTYLICYLSAYLTYLPIAIPSYLCTYLPAYLPTYLPTLLLSRYAFAMVILK